MGSDDNHKEDEEREADGVDRMSDTWFYRAANNTFNDDKEKSSAIKRRNGNKIDEREINGNDSRDGEEISDALY